jgi:uracil-DNA glycosylase
MSMTREDVLREFELLPVWRLRTPLKTEAQATMETLTVEVQAEETIEVTRYECTISDDKKWVFVCPADHAPIASQSTLFNNILHALKIEKTNQVQLESFANIEASVIIAMGETTAQQLLNSTESIESLRGKTHLLENAPLIVTYHLNDMLQHLPNKAKTWEDLCIARSIVGT